MSHEESGVPQLAARLSFLFATVPRAGTGGRTLWNNETAAEALTAAGVATSPAYLSQLRSGKRINPSARLLRAIAELFDVPTDYFFDADLAARLQDELGLLDAMRDSGVRGIALRAHGLSASGLGQLRGMIEEIRRREHLAEGRSDEENSDEGDARDPPEASAPD